MSALKGAVLLVPSAVAATLAAWQIQRMQWKVSSCRVVRVCASVDETPASSHETAAAALPLTTTIYPPSAPLHNTQQGVVDQATHNMQLPPVDLLQGAVPEFRRVAIEGVYDHSRAAFVGPRPLR